MVWEIGGRKLGGKGVLPLKIGQFLLKFVIGANREKNGGRSECVWAFMLNMTYQLISTLTQVPDWLYD